MKSSGDKLKLYGYLFKDKKRLFLLVGLNTVATLLTTGLALVYGELVNYVADPTHAGLVNYLFDVGDNVVLGLVYGSIAALIYSLAVAGLRWFLHYYQSVFWNRLHLLIQNAYFERKIAATFEDISGADSSKYFDEMNQDAGTAAGSMNYLITNINWVVGLVSSFVAAVALQWWIALAMVGFTVLMGIIPLLVKKKLGKAYVELSAARKDNAFVAKEHLQGADIIKAFNGENHARRAFSDTLNRYLRKQSKTVGLEASSTGVAGIVQMCAMLMLVSLTCYSVVSGTLAVGAVLSMVQIGTTFYSNCQEVAVGVTWILSKKPIRDKVWAVVGQPLANTEPDERFSFHRSLEFKEVSFAYPNGDRTVFDRVSVTFEKGKKYLVLGRSGSGKSTLLKLIAKFYTTYEGEILMDGVSYQNIEECNVTKVVASAAQRCYLFRRPIEKNIDFMDKNDKEKLTKILDITALDEFVASLPQGLDTVIDEEVFQVSGGEKLRINLARALYRDSEILLLDEVTSALDKQTAARVENNLMDFQDKTIINVCHKFNDSSLPRYDKILIFEHGKIVAEGTFEELKNSKLLMSYRNIEEGVSEAQERANAAVAEG